MPLRDECSEKVPRRVWLSRSHRREQRDRELGQALADVVQKAQRGAVGPVGIVDNEQQWRPLRKIGAQPEEPVHECENAVLFRAQLAGGPIAEQGQAQSGGTGEQLLTSTPILASEPRLEELQADAEREIAFEFRAATDEHVHSFVPRPLNRLGDERGLAESGMTFNDEQLAIAGPNRPKRRRDFARFLLSLEQPADRTNLTRGSACHPQTPCRSLGLELEILARRLTDVQDQ